MFQSAIEIHTLIKGIKHMNEEIEWKTYFRCEDHTGILQINKIY